MARTQYFCSTGRRRELPPTSKLIFSTAVLQLGKLFNAISASWSWSQGYIQTKCGSCTFDTWRVYLLWLNCVVILTTSWLKLFRASKTNVNIPLVLRHAQSHLETCNKSGLNVNSHNASQAIIQAEDPRHMPCMPLCSIREPCHPCNQCSIVARGIERWEHRGSQYLIKQWRNTILPQRHTHTHTVSGLSCKGHRKEDSRPSVILHRVEKGQWLVV